MKLLSIALFFISLPAFSATVNMAVDLGGSLITIHGDSNLKKWVVKAKSFSGSGSFEMEGERLKEVKDFTLTLDAKKIKGGRHSMDKKTAETLDVAHFPIIAGTIKKSTIKDHAINGLMEFNLHGVKKTLKFSAQLSYSRGRIKVEGEQNLDMTDFGISPPVSKILFLTATVMPKLVIKYKFELIPI